MSNRNEASFAFTHHVRDHCLCLHVQRAARALARRFDEAIAHSIERVVMTVQRLLSDARTRADDINTIFLTGGSSMVPLLRESILTLFPGARIAESDLLGSVGIGLSLDARSKFA